VSSLVKRTRHWREWRAARRGEPGAGGNCRRRQERRRIV